MVISKKSPVIIIVIAALVLCVFLLWVALSQQELTVYELNDYGPYGLKAVSLLLKKEGYTTREINAFSPNFSGILVINTTNPLDAVKRRSILRWVRSGGVLIELAQFKPVINPAKLKEIPELWRGKRAGSSSTVQWLKDLKYFASKDILYTVDKPDEGFYETGYRFFIYGTKCGAGRIIHWNDPGGITNLHLREHPDNAVIFVMLVKMCHTANIGFYNLTGEKKAPVEFEFGKLLDRYWEAGFVLLLGIILLLWRLSSRFGRPRPLILAKGRSADEFVFALAGLLQQADAKAVVLDNMCICLRELIVKITGLPGETGIQELINRLNHITGKDYGEICLLFEKARNPKISKLKFMDIAKKLDAYRRELEEWIKSAR